jgi:hypothetical protein
MYIQSKRMIKDCYQIFDLSIRKLWIIVISVIISKYW